MKNQCDICNRTIERHLQKQGKRLCFACLTEEVSETGAIPVFNLKQKPVQAPCAVCDTPSSGNDLMPSPWGFICQDCCDICSTQTGMSWEMVKVGGQREWIIKANTKIMGPYNTEEVEALLRENRVVAHDEIIRPTGRWHLLRDEEQFRLVLNEVRNRDQNRREKSTEITNSQTMTPSAEILVSERVFLTENMIETVRPKKETSAKMAAEVKETRDLIKSYAAQDDVKIISELTAIRKKRIWLAMIVFLAAGVYAALKFIQPHGGNASDRNHAFQELMENALRAEKVGDYRSALSQYSEARTYQPSDPELLLHLAPLVMTYDHQYRQAEAMFSQLLSTESDPNYQKASYMGLGLIAMEDHDLDTAETYFAKARGLDSEYMPAIANMGNVAMQRGDFQNAEDLLLKAMEKGATDGAVVISLADVSLSETGSSGTPSRAKLQQAHQVLEQFLNLSRDYQQEVLVEDARVLAALDKDSEVARKIEVFLDVDPELTDLHVRDWQVYRGRASWGLLYDSLKKVSSHLSSSPRLSAALGLAMYRGQEKLEGANDIEQAFAQAPDDPLLMALAGWVELKLGHHENAVVNIRRAALTTQEYKLPHIMAARLCEEEKDYECAKTNWEQVLALDARSSAALNGLAQVAWSKEDKGTANMYLTQLYANDPTYIPYLRLIQQVQSMGNNP